MEEDDFISKTRRKKHMIELQKVGADLVRLSPEQLARIDMPEELREAVLACQRFTKHEAVRRQMQYIGRIMRDLDAGPIMEQLAALHAPSHRQTALFHLAEKWRDELLSDGDAATRFAQEFPEADPHRLRTLCEKAQAEREADKPPKHYRELFHVLNTILQDHARRAR
ncbi:MAG TPA: ribosome biogenesis factor YjgA [Usitatibacter sp.]|jgi:ribosome-associated protein|nr:ribosome biogenesis factor YjgA [Usitatibacter sp.]